MVEHDTFNVGVAGSIPASPTIGAKQTIKARLSVVPFVFLPTTRAIMQGQEPDGLSLTALRTTLAAASQWAFAQSIFLTTANWSEQEKFLGLTKQQESC